MTEINLSTLTVCDARPDIRIDDEIGTFDEGRVTIDETAAFIDLRPQRVIPQPTATTTFSVTAVDRTLVVLKDDKRPVLAFDLD